MIRMTLTAVATLSLALPLAAGQVKAVDSFNRVKPDVDLLIGFERCGAPSGLYARLQDELLFAAGAEGLLKDASSLGGLDPRPGVQGLLVAVRGPAMLAVVPPGQGIPAGREPEGGADARHVRKLTDGTIAYGDLSLLRDETAELTGVSPPAPSLLRNVPANRCACAIARPAWVRGESSAPLDAADVAGRSVLRSLGAVRSLTLTADLESDIEISLRVSAADPEDAAVLADALEEFLASRRGNAEAPEAVRSAIERATVRRDAETVLFQLPLSEAALDRIRRNPDSRTLLRLSLDDAERERWQKVAEIARALGVRKGDQVADVGAGGGFFSVRLARAVGPSGRVFAVEIGEKALAALSRRAEAASLGNVQAVLGAPDDPRLPKGSLDAALIVNAYHEMPAYDGMLARLFESLKPGGRLVLIEPWSIKRRDESRASQVKDHIIAPEIAEQELTHAGFEIAKRRDDFIPSEQRPEWLIQAIRPAVSRGPAPR